jgi:hypothetical protein
VAKLTFVIHTVAPGVDQVQGAWSIDNERASLHHWNRLDIPLLGRGLLEALHAEKWLHGPFRESDPIESVLRSFKLETSTLEVGEYYPRIYRPNCPYSKNAREF